MINPLGAGAGWKGPWGFQHLGGWVYLTIFCLYISKMLWDFLLEKKTTKQNQHIHQVWSMCCSPEMCVVFGSVKFGLPCWKSGFMCKKNTSVGSYQSESKSRHSPACWNLHFKHFSLSARQWMLRIRWALPWHSTGLCLSIEKVPWVVLTLVGRVSACGRGLELGEF